MGLIALTDTNSGASFSLDQTDIIKIYDKDSQTIVEHISGESSRNVAIKVDGAVATVAALASNVFSTTYLGGTIYLNADRVISVEEVSSKAWVTYDNNGEKPELLKLDVSKATFEAAIPNIAVTDLLIGATLYVSSQGLTVANGASRENLSKHFSDLGEAYTAANDGDTIVIMPGTYTFNQTNANKSLNYVCLGNPTITGNFNIGNTGGGEAHIRILGNGIFVSTSQVFYSSNASSTMYVEAESATGSLAPTFFFSNGRGVFHFSDKVDNTAHNTFRIDGACDLTVNCNRCLNSRTGNVRGTIYPRGTFTGTFTLNADYIEYNPGTFASAAFMWPEPGGSGTVTINARELKHLGTGTTQYVFYNNGDTLTTNFNCDIDAGAAYGFRTAGAGTTLNHTGKMVNDGTYSLVWLSGANSNVTLKGEYTSSNDTTFIHASASDTLVIDGKINNTSTTAGQKECVDLSAAGTLVLYDVVAVLDGGAGTPNAVYAGAARNVKIYKLITTHNVNVNVTNIISGALIAVDTDVE